MNVLWNLLIITPDIGMALIPWLILIRSDKSGDESEN